VAQNRRKMSLGKDTMKFVDEHLDWDEEALCRQYLKQMRDNEEEGEKSPKQEIIQEEEKTKIRINDDNDEIDAS